MSVVAIVPARDEAEHVAADALVDTLDASRWEARVAGDEMLASELLVAVEEFQPHQHPEAYERICNGFTAGSWGKPSRVFRFTAESFERIRPVG